ncbi:MAG: EamA family transporter [Eubacteriales bacterium]|nr:EamA family transporter [Eubacteriales bacterium]MDD3882287.1 EamA family transporter [Eubacteriales bacterium]MDD4512033.1 EamA family transporter [Eubacteriales bacterium]
MWLALALFSALFAGITAILSKIGLKDTDSNVATAVRTVVVLLFSWLMVLITGVGGELSSVSARALLFLCLSGLATGASWLCYFRALQLGNVNRVAPIDKSSTILTMLLAFILLGERVTWLKCGAMALILLGTLMMIQKKEAADKKEGRAWLVYAVLSAVFAALTSILGKVGIENVNSNLGTALRTIVVLIMAWTMVFVTRKTGEVRKIDRRSMLFILLSGLATGLSWLCYYGALHDPAALVSVVTPLDKLSILPTVLFARVFLREKLTKRGVFGLCLLTGGTLMLLI